ncbi:MAG TPA: hypothetical protein GXZ24_04140 [Firmicutes bacterium]|nr:hypothetical protein [Bacillota bacterium]
MMKHAYIFLGKKALAVFLILCLLNFLLAGIMAGPNTVEAADGKEKIEISKVQWLNKEVKVAIEVEGFDSVAALSFKVIPKAGYAVKITDITAGKGLSKETQMDYYISKNGVSANVGIYVLKDGAEQCVVKPKNGEQLQLQLANIIFTHNKSEGSRPFEFEITDIVAFDVSGHTINIASVESGIIDIKIIYGDLNYSGSVTVADAVIAMSAVIGEKSLTPEEKNIGNVSRGEGAEPGDLTIYDVLLIAQCAAGIIGIKDFPVSGGGSSTGDD